MACYAEVALMRHSYATDQLYTYVIPDDMRAAVSPGARVVVSFGRGETPYEACVLDVHERTPDFTAKPLRSVFPETGALSASQIALCRWLRETTLCTWTEALQTMLPSGMVLKRSVSWTPVEGRVPKGLDNGSLAVIDCLEVAGWNPEKLEPAQRKEALRLVKAGILAEAETFFTEVREKRLTMLEAVGSEEDLPGAFRGAPGRLDLYREILRFLSLVGPLPSRELKAAVGAETRHLKTLVDKGLLRQWQEREDRTPLMLKDFEPEAFQALTPAQEAVVKAVEAAAPGSEWLLHGVTGSGKTEVYLHLARSVVAAGRQVLVLVPEISLTPQIVRRFANRFGDRIAVLHSRLSAGERFDQWERIRNRQAEIVIGPRSALFAPFTDLGLIIMDEEHDQAYKSESAPRYHSRDVARYLTGLTGARLLMGSATPSVETYWEARKGTLGLLELPDRVNRQPMPAVRILDMREELMAGNRGLLSRELAEGIHDRLQKGEQVLLLLNRKGYASYLNCRSCGFVLKCPKCDISMTYFKGGRHARCSYCGYAAPVAPECPECGSPEYMKSGAGTERLEEYLQSRFPEARIGRMDAESTSRKGALEALVHQAEAGLVDILLGTQMIAKGLHFPGVTLVGILSADLTLCFPDYKANERAFQLLTQVSGRTGRGERPGEVLIQTARPDHYAILFASGHDYVGYYQSEGRLRKAFRYPPFVSMVNLVLSGEREETVLKAAKGLYNEVGHGLKAKNLTFQLLGPHPAAFARIRGAWRYQILLKHLPQDALEIYGELRRLRQTIPSGVTLVVDTSPVTTL